MSWLHLPSLTFAALSWV